MYIWWCGYLGITSAQSELQKERDARKKLEETILTLKEQQQTTIAMNTNTNDQNLNFNNDQHVFSSLSTAESIPVSAQPALQVMFYATTYIVIKE